MFHSIVLKVSCIEELMEIKENQKSHRKTVKSPGVANKRPAKSTQ